MKKLRLLAISHDYSLTGAPVNFFHLISELSSQYEITVASDVDGPLRKQFTDRGLGGMVIPGLLKDIRTVEGVLTSFDGLLANTIVAFNPVLAAASIPKPSIWTLQEAASWGGFIKRNSPLLRLALGIATTVVSTSEYSVGIYRRWRNREYPVIYAGIPPFKRLTQKIVRESDDPLRILLVGTIQPRKAQDVAVAALKRIPVDKLQRFSLEFIGKVENPDYYRKLMQSIRISTPSGPQTIPVKWSGERTPPQVFEAMHRSDIILVPSREEVTPVVVLEAMTFGKCVVAHRVGGLGEMIQDGVTGRLFRPNDLAHLVEILLELEANREEIPKLGDSAYHFVREQRSLAKSAEQYSKLIEQAFRDRIPRPEISIAKPLPPIFTTNSSSQLPVQFVPNAAAK